MTIVTRFLILSAVVFSQLSSANGQQLIGVLEVPGSDRDQSGLTKKLEDGTAHDQLGGFSAIDYSPQSKTFFVAPDRGPKDGAVSYHCRLQTLSLAIEPHKQPPITAEWAKPIMLVDSENRPLIGLSRQFTPSRKMSHRFDPEGLRVLSSGNFVVTDEYGPYVLLFSPEGKELRRFDVPAHYLIKNPGTSKKEENNNNSSGRQCNRGMEGLALSTCGKFLYGLMQSPLLQDSKMNSKGKPMGYNCRIVRIEIESGKVAEYVYRLDDKKNKLNEILAINETEFLVIERDGEAGEDARFKKIIKIDLEKATCIDGSKSLPVESLGGGIEPAQKEVYIDMLDPKYNLRGKQMPEKIEGLCFGPRLADGRRTLVIASDNDFQSEQASRLYVFALYAK